MWNSSPEESKLEISIMLQFQCESKPLKFGSFLSFWNYAFDMIIFDIVWKTNVLTGKFWRAFKTSLRHCYWTVWSFKFHPVDSRIRLKTNPLITCGRCKNHFRKHHWWYKGYTRNVLLCDQYWVGVWTGPGRLANPHRLMVRAVIFRSEKCRVMLDRFRVSYSWLVLDGIEDFVDGELQRGKVLFRLEGSKSIWRENWERLLLHLLFHVGEHLQDMKFV